MTSFTQISFHRQLWSHVGRNLEKIKNKRGVPVSVTITKWSILKFEKWLREREPISVAFSVNCFVWPLNDLVLGKSCPLRELTVFFLSVLIMFCCCIPRYCFGYICFRSGLFPCLVLVNQANTTTTMALSRFLIFLLLYSV